MSLQTKMGPLLVKSALSKSKISVSTGLLLDTQNAVLCLVRPTKLSPPRSLELKKLVSTQFYVSVRLLPRERKVVPKKFFVFSSQLSRKQSSTGQRL